MAGRVRPEDVAAVRERVRIDSVIGEVVSLRSAGAGSLKGLCPFHEERSPSFHVTPARGFYHCFGCNEGGDVFDFLIKLEKVTFTDALEKLAGRAGITLRYEDGSGPERRGPNRVRLAQANAIAAKFFVARLNDPQAEPGRAFLAGRGFAPESWEIFGVGFAPRSWDALLQHLRQNGFSDAESVAAGLASQGARGTIDRFRGRLLWPIRDAAGDVLGFGARRMSDDDGPKYLNTPETPLYRKSAVLYGIDLARREISRTRQVVVVEGYTDVMAAHLAGVTNTVATCGTAFGGEHAALLRRHLMDDDALRGEVVFTFDGDAAGQRAALRAFEGDQRFVAQTFVAVSPDGMDPCELRVSRGDAAVRELVASRTPLFEFAIRSTLAQFDLSRAEGRVGAMRAAAPIVAGIRDTALRPEYTRLLAGWVGLPESQIRAEVATAARAADRGPARADGRSGAGPGRSAAGSAARPAGAEVGPGSGRPGTGLPGGARPGNAADTPGGAVVGQARPDRRDPALFVQREALKCALQVPDLLTGWYPEVTDGCYRHPAYQLVHRSVVAAGGITSAQAPSEWVGDVLGACPDDLVRALVRELAVEPLVTAGEPDARYATSIVARLLKDEVDGRIAEHVRVLSAMVQTDPDQMAKVLADLMDLEAYRRDLGRVGQEDQ